MRKNIHKERRKQNEKIAKEYAEKMSTLNDGLVLHCNFTQKEVKNDAGDITVTNRGAIPTDIGLYIDGNTTHYVEVSINPSLNILREITMSAWVKLDIIGGGVKNKILARYNTTIGDGISFEFYIETDDTVRGGIHGTTDIYPTSSPAPISDTDWHHAVFVYDGYKMLTYLDAILQITDDSTGNLNAHISAGACAIGRRGGDTFLGYMRHVRIYHRALKDEEIKELFRRKI